MISHPLLSKLDSIANLPKNWDSYNSDAIKPGAVDQARKFLEFEIQKGMTAYRNYNVYPTCAGNVGIEWTEDEIDVTIVFEETTVSIDLENLILFRRRRQ